MCIIIKPYFLAEQLQAMVQGEVYSMDSDYQEYDRLTKVWTIPRDHIYYPRYIIVPETKEDIVTAVRIFFSFHFFF